MLTSLVYAASNGYNLHHCAQRSRVQIQSDNLVVSMDARNGDYFAGTEVNGVSLQPITAGKSATPYLTG